MSTNFLYAQSPNRTGNVSKHTPGSGGVTAVTAAKHGTATPKGSQGAPKANGNVFPVGNKVSVSYAKESCGCNTGYMKNSSYLK